MRTQCRTDAHVWDAADGVEGIGEEQAIEGRRRREQQERTVAWSEELNQRGDEIRPSDESQNAPPLRPQLDEPGSVRAAIQKRERDERGHGEADQERPPPSPRLDRRLPEDEYRHRHQY